MLLPETDSWDRIAPARVTEDEPNVGIMISNLYLMIFAVAMAGCVLTTPLVTWVASWVGAIDRPDQFRRIHQGAIPRLGWAGPGDGCRRGDAPDVPARAIPGSSRR